MKKKSNIKKSDNLVSKSYILFLNQIKKDIQQTQLKAAQLVTKELVLLYWRIGNNLSEKSKVSAWGSKVVQQLADDLEKAFPGLAGFSFRNLKYMKKFAETFPDLNRAAAAALIPWGHTMVLLDKLENNDQQLWYAKKTIENGWSRSVLTMWIESDLYKRQGKAVNNFKATLPNTTSDLAEQTLKDPYNFEFLTIDQKAREREIEQGLMDHIQKFLLELGQGFSFVGRQYHLTVGNQDLYVDMLFYHLQLRCYIVVELKAKEFDAKDLGQTNLYLASVDKLLRHRDDAPTIGLLLCKSKDNVVAEWALSTSNRPIGISSYTVKLVESLPKEFKGKLPTIKEIEAELKKQGGKLSTKRTIRKKTKK